jgi:hypothetical protein
MLERPVTSPTPLSILNDVAPETFHARVTGFPGALVLGIDVKEEITGAWLLAGEVFCQTTWAVAPPWRS